MPSSNLTPPPRPPTPRPAPPPDSISVPARALTSPSFTATGSPRRPMRPLDADEEFMGMQARVQELERMFGLLHDAGIINIADGSVTFVKLGDDVKPSVDALPADEALRSLGPGADQAAPGNDPRFAGIGSGGSDYQFAQVIASASWSVPHNLNKPAVGVFVYDSTNQLIMPNTVTLVDDNNLTIDFLTAMSGKAVIL